MSTVEIEELKEVELNDTPEFYTSLSNNPITDIVKNRPVYSSMYIFRGFSDFEVTIPASVMIGVPGEITAQIPHNIRNIALIKIAIVSNNYLFIPQIINPGLSPQSGYSFDSLKIYPTYYTFRARNVNTTPRTVKLRTYLFEVKLLT